MASPLSITARKIARDRNLSMQEICDPFGSGFIAQQGTLEVTYLEGMNIEGFHIKRESQIYVGVLDLTSGPYAAVNPLRSLAMEVHKGCLLDYLMLLNRYGKRDFSLVETVRNWMEQSLPERLKYSSNPTLANIFAGTSFYLSTISLCDAFFPRDERY